MPMPETSRLFAALALSLLLDPAQARTLSEGEVFAFTPNGDRFVFMQSHIEDGVGSPNARGEIIDVESDSWVEGSPFVEAPGEAGAEQPLETAKQTVLTRLENKIGPIADLQTGRLVWHRPPQQLDGHGYSAQFALKPYIRNFDASSRDVWTVKLSEIHVTDDGRCYGQYDTVAGFRLDIAGGPEGFYKRLHNDVVVPASRGCTIGYAVERVYVHDRNDGYSLAVILRVQKMGFEGPDGHLMAVTARLPE